MVLTANPLRSPSKFISVVAVEAKGRTTRTAGQHRHAPGLPPARGPPHTRTPVPHVTHCLRAYIRSGKLHLCWVSDAQPTDKFATCGGKLCEQLVAFILMPCCTAWLHDQILQDRNCTEGSSPSYRRPFQLLRPRGPRINASSPAADCSQAAQHLVCSQSRRQSCGRRPRTAPPAARRQQRGAPIWSRPAARSMRTCGVSHSSSGVGIRKAHW